MYKIVDNNGKEYGKFDKYQKACNEIWKLNRSKIKIILKIIETE